MAQRQRNGLIIRGSQVRILLGPPDFPPARFLARWNAPLTHPLRSGLDRLHTPSRCGRLSPGGGAYRAVSRARPPHLNFS